MQIVQMVAFQSQLPGTEIYYPNIYIGMIIFKIYGAFPDPSGKSGPVLWDLQWPLCILLLV